MVRADRNYPNVYFGKPGSLVTMPYPRGGIDKSYDRDVYNFGTASGQHIVSSMISGSRAYSIAWNALHVDNYDRLAQYWVGMMGVGPWAFIDPSISNMLLENVSSGTNKFMDTRGWGTPTHGAISSNNNAAQVHRTGATRSLRWLWVSAPGAVTAVLGLSSPYRSWYGYPAVPGLSYAFSSWIKPDGTVDASITGSVRLRWIGPTGTQLSEITGGDVVTTAWTRHSVVGVAPAGTAYVQPVWVVTGSTVAAGGSLYIDEPLLEQDSVVNNWASGTGLKASEILGLSEGVPFNAMFRKNIELELQELAP